MPFSGLVTNSGEILNISKSYKKNQDGLFLNDDLAMKLLMLLFVDDHVLISSTEDKLQKASYKVNQIITERGLTIFVQKLKLMAFRGRDPFRSKIEIDNKRIEHVHSFNY